MRRQLTIVVATADTARAGRPPDDRPWAVVHVRHVFAKAIHEVADVRHVRVIDVFGFVGHLVIVAVQTRRHEHDRDP
jgi:hypothetical protein